VKISRSIDRLDGFKAEWNLLFLLTLTGKMNTDILAMLSKKNGNKEYKYGEA
jgi:hypothetical protein